MFTHVCSSSMYSHAFSFFFFFFFNDTATTEIYTLSLHDALPIYIILVGKGVASGYAPLGAVLVSARVVAAFERGSGAFIDRKSTRLNSSHITISYAVFCLKKKKKKNNIKIKEKTIL